MSPWGCFHAKISPPHFLQEEEEKNILLFGLINFYDIYEEKEKDTVLD